MAAIMPDYITLHASAYPPTSWAFLANRQSKPSRTTKNELWIEMTNRYDRSMARRRHDFTKNRLSETATEDNVGKLDSDALKLYHQRATIAFGDMAVVDDVLEIASRFVEAVDELAKNAMDTIPEEDELGAIHSGPQLTVRERLRCKQAISNTENYQQLLQSTYKIKDTFRVRLREIHSICHQFICPRAGKHPHPRWAQIRRIHREVTDHVANVAQKQVTFEVAKLRVFLRGQLFDEYCLMRGTPMEKKDETWLRYGKCVMLGKKNSKCGKSLTKETAETRYVGDREDGERLDRMIDASGLDPSWVMDHMEEYYAGNGHIGRWQRYMQDRRWKDLAAKFTDDIQQLKKINRATNSSKSRRCQIMSNIQNTKRQFFNRLNGAQDFELSEKASKMDEGYESTSNSSSTSSLSSEKL